MASMVTSVVIGDYRYYLYDDGTARAEVNSNLGKTSYGQLQQSVSYQGATYSLISLERCFYGCYALTTAPEIPSGVTSMTECFRGCSALANPPTIPDTVTNLEWAFRDCTSMTAPPTLPSSAQNLHGCFRGCTSLASAPVIPVRAYNIAACFYGCTSLTAAPSIPPSVTQVNSCFSQCTALTGNISVSGTPSSYSSCFLDTTLPIRLICSSDAILTTWQQVAATGNNGNVIAVYVENNPAPTATLNVTRVGSDGSTVPNESGEWAYVRVETTISTDQAPDNVARAPIVTKDGSSVVPSTHASGTASYVDWVSLGDDKTHRIGATPRDLYKSGGEVIVPLAGTYSPMEFYTKPILNDDDEVIGYEGGVGASFGKHATREGVLDVAWDVESEGEVSCGVSGGVPAHTLSSKVTVDDVYPIGSVYMNVSATDPSTLFPGTTWRALAPGRVLVGAGTTTDSRGESKTFSNGASGGEFSHLLSGQESGVKGHTHKLNECRTNAETSGYGLTATSGFSDRVLVDTSVDARKRATETSGDIAATSAHNNIQPYLVVHMWERTA